LLKHKPVILFEVDPRDDEFVLWLTPKLGAAEYSVFADTFTLKTPPEFMCALLTALGDLADY